MKGKKLFMPHKNIYKIITVDGQQYRRQTETTNM